MSKSFTRQAEELAIWTTGGIWKFLNTTSREYISNVTKQIEIALSQAYQEGRRDGILKSEIICLNEAKVLKLINPNLSRMARVLGESIRNSEKGGLNEKD